MADKFGYMYADPTNTLQVTGSTPYGTYDNDIAFQSESLSVCKFVARRLGHPVMQIEMNSGSIYAMFEEAVSEYSTQINNYNMRNWLWDQYGNTSRVSGSNWSSEANTSSYAMGTGSNEPVMPNMGISVGLSEQYGVVTNVGGGVSLKSGSITLKEDEQDYDLQNVWADISESGKRIEVQRVYNFGQAAMTKFYDPFAGSYDQRLMLDNFGFGNVSPSVSLVLRPISQDITRAQAIETSDKIRKSAYSFEIINNRLKIFPRPTGTDAGDKIYFEYYVRDDLKSTSRTYTTNKVSDPSNAPYKYITYKDINSTGRQWIRKYTLALSKELLGIVRSKYASMPLPNGEVSLDGEALKAEGREEKTAALEELKEFLESVSLSERSRQEQEQADAQQAVLNKAPLGIYIG